MYNSKRPLLILLMVKGTHTVYFSSSLYITGLEIMGFVIGDILTCVSIHSILPLLSLNNNANINPGHNTDIGLDYNVIHSHTDKPRYPGLYCMKFPSFIHAIIMAAPMLCMECDEKCVRRPE